MPDGSLPSVKVRSTMLRLLLQLNFYFEDRKVGRPLICCCEAGCVLSALWLRRVVMSVCFLAVPVAQLMPVPSGSGLHVPAYCADDVWRNPTPVQEQLKKSQLGHVIMFLSKLPDELPANRRMARELVQRWSRPIFEAYRNDRCGASGSRPSYTTRGSTTRSNLLDCTTTLLPKCTSSRCSGKCSSRCGALMWYCCRHAPLLRYHPLVRSLLKPKHPTCAPGRGRRRGRIGRRTRQGSGCCRAGSRAPWTSRSARCGPTRRASGAACRFFDSKA
jgi:TFIIS helical bundle-like domain